MMIVGEKVGRSKIRNLLLLSAFILLFFKGTAIFALILTANIHSKTK